MRNLTRFLILVVSTLGFLLTAPAQASFFSRLMTNVGLSQAVPVQADTPSMASKMNQFLDKADNLDPEVLKLALRAYDKAKSKGISHKPVLTIIDYSIPSTSPRLWVLDLNKNDVLLYTHVAHGQMSGEKNAHFFSDQPGSRASSLGVFLTGDTYYGHSGYSLNLHGLEKGFNSHAYERRVVIHGAAYVSGGSAQKYGRLGRSWGCPAVASSLAPQLINTIKSGSVVFAYYPDKRWLNNSRFLS